MGIFADWKTKWKQKYSSTKESNKYKIANYLSHEDFNHLWTDFKNDIWSKFGVSGMQNLSIVHVDESGNGSINYDINNNGFILLGYLYNNIDPTLDDLKVNIHQNEKYKGDFKFDIFQIIVIIIFFVIKTCFFYI